MTNNEIIYSEVNAKYHTPEQRRAILALAYTPEQIAAKGKEIHFKDVPEERHGWRWLCSIRAGFGRLPEGSDSPPNGSEKQV